MWLMKEQFICGLDSSFSIFSESALVAYSCDREGDQYINCREVKRRPVDSRAVVDDGVTYRFENGDYWIVIFEIE